MFDQSRADWRSLAMEGAPILMPCDYCEEHACCHATEETNFDTGWPAMLCSMCQGTLMTHADVRWHDAAVAAGIAI